MLCCVSASLLAEGSCAFHSSAGYSCFTVHVILYPCKCQRDAPQGSRTVDVSGTAHSSLVALHGRLQQQLCDVFLEELTHQGLLVFGLSWVLTCSNYSQQLPFSLRAVRVFHGHIRTLQTSQCKTSIVKGAITWQPRPCAPLTRCSFLNHLCFPISSCIPFNDASYGLLVCVTDAVCSLMKQ